MNLILWGTVASFIIAEILKSLIDLKRGLSFTLFRQGGMPSVHTALVTSITTSIYLTEGASNLFFLSLVLALLIINDAFNVREEAGKHAAILNKHFNLHLKERLGHTPLEVAAGAALGIIIPILFSLVM